MTPEEVSKINELYQQLDTLQAENDNLKQDVNLVDRLKSIEQKLDLLLDKPKKKS